MNRRGIYITAACLLSFFMFSCDKIGINRKTKASDLQISGITIGTGATELETPKAEFLKNEKIFITYDLQNIVSVKDGSGEYFWIRQDLMVQDSKNAIVIMQPDVLNIKDEIAHKPAKFVNEFSLADIEKAVPGRYTVTILATDISGMQAAKTRILITIR